MACLALMAACSGGEGSPPTTPAPPAPPAPPPVPPAPSPPSGWAGAPDWNGAAGSGAHTGFVPVTVDVGKLRELWRGGATVRGSIEWSATSDSLAIGVNRLSIDSQFVTAVNVLTGGIRWTVPATKLWEADRGVLLAGAYRTIAMSPNGASLQSIDPATGVTLGQIAVERYRSTMSLALLADTEAVYAMLEPHGQLVRLDAVTGAERARFQYSSVGQGGGIADPALRDSVIVAFVARTIDAIEGSSPLGLLVWNKRSGALLQSTTPADDISRPGTPAVTDDAVYVVAGGKLRRFSRATGAEVWRRPYCHNSFAVTPQTVYALCEGAARALRATDGVEQWNWQPAGGFPYSTNGILATNNVLFVSGLTATAVDLATHAPVWSYDLPATVFVASPRGVIMARTESRGWVGLAGN